MQVQCIIYCSCSLFVMHQLTGHSSIFSQPATADALLVCFSGSRNVLFASWLVFLLANAFYPIHCQPYIKQCASSSQHLTSLHLAIPTLHPSLSALPTHHPAHCPAPSRSLHCFHCQLMVLHFQIVLCIPNYFLLVLIFLLWVILMHDLLITIC